MGSRLGTLKTAAQRLGIPFQAYVQILQAGGKWCYKCREWRSRTEFSADVTRGDGRKAVCNRCDGVRTTPGPSKKQRRDMRSRGASWCRRCHDWKLLSEVHAGLCRSHGNEEARRLYAESERFRMSRRQHAHSRRRGVAAIPPEAQQMLIEEFEGRCAY